MADRKNCTKHAHGNIQVIVTGISCVCVCIVCVCLLYDETVSLGDVTSLGGSDCFVILAWWLNRLRFSFSCSCVCSSPACICNCLPFKYVHVQLDCSTSSNLSTSYSCEFRWGFVCVSEPPCPLFHPEKTEIPPLHPAPPNPTPSPSASTRL